MKTQTTPQRYSAVSTEFSLRTDGRWLSVGGKDDVLRSDDFLDIANWLDGRRALNLGISVYADDRFIISKNPGGTAIELIHAPDGFTG